MLRTARFTSRSALTATKATALAAAFLLVLPATAMAWPMHGQNPANTDQATADGPSDPGLKMYADLEEIQGLQDRENYSVLNDSNNAPLISENGTIIRRAQWNHPDDGATRSLVAVDEDGKLAWAFDGLKGMCAPVIDSQDRVWVLLPRPADRSYDFAIQALDADTGQPISDTLLPFERDVLDPILPTQVCTGSRTTSLHVGAVDGAELIVVPAGTPAFSVATTVIDISGDVPVLATQWADEDGTEFRREAPQQRAMAFTDAGMVFIAAHHTDDPDDDAVVRVHEIGTGLTDFADSQDYVDLPVPAEEATDLASTHLMVTDTHVVAFVRYHQSSADRGVIVGIDRDTWQVDWTNTHDNAPNNAANSMALSGNTFIYNFDLGRLFGIDVATGDEVAWSGQIPVRERGGSTNDFDVTTDASGAIYTVGRDSTSQPWHLLRHNPDGELDWAVSFEALEDATGRSLGDSLRIGGITDEGHLVLYGGIRNGSVVVLDNSGGLVQSPELPAPTPPSLPTFSDVTPGSTHSRNIQRLAVSEITEGFPDGTFQPQLNITREQMASFLDRALDLPNAPAGSFSDVSGTHARAIDRVAAAGITQGYGDGTFGPRDHVTREQMASFLVRALDL